MARCIYTPYSSQKNNSRSVDLGRCPVDLRQGLGTSIYALEKTFTVDKKIRKCTSGRQDQYQHGQ